MSFYNDCFIFRFQVFSNPEDTKLSSSKDAKVTFTDPDVERIRRNHLNDMENILPFVIIGLFYVGINPSPTQALWHFRIFFFSRIFHTIAYQVIKEIDLIYYSYPICIYNFSCHYPNHRDLLDLLSAMV